MSEETQFSSKQIGFFLIAINASPLEGSKNCSAVLFMFLHGLGPYDNVIEIYMANFANEFSECVCHSTLVCCWSITSTLWHDSPFIEAPWCSYSSEVNVVGVYSCLEEGVCHIHLAKNLALPAVSEYIINTGQGETISHSVFVQCLVVIYPPGIN